MFSDLEDCQHIEKVLNTNNRTTVLDTYRQAIKISLLINSSNTFKLVKDNSKFSNDKLQSLKINALKCSNCKLNNFNNNLICLQCPNIGCQINDHHYSHYKLSQHLFAIDSSNGLIFCFKCNNYINNSSLNDIRLSILDIGHQKNLNEFSSSRDKNDDNDFNIDEEFENPTNLSINGLKGFINFGSTCFISSILQTFIHNPIIKYDFFNNDDHYFNCDESTCITCSIDKIFTDFFTVNNNDSFGMTNLLINSWYKNKSLTGFEEQDAHEFWQFLLNQFHKDFQRVQGPELSNGDKNRSNSIYGNCNCIKHKYFHGELESSIKCSNCGNVTKKIDPNFDLSLELTNLPSNSTIYDCLNLFTSNEILDNYSCPNCSKNSKPIKSLKINQLSPILSIQLKRFKHTLSNFVKNDLLIKNPLYLDLSSYLSTPNNIKNSFYELFALIVHTGSVNTGHYIVIIKIKNQWIKFDDSIVTLVPQKEIESINAYLLFYIVHDLKT